MVSYGCYKCGLSGMLNFEWNLNTLVLEHERMDNSI
jgi:hypothetical protein